MNSIEWHARVSMNRCHTHLSSGPINKPNGSWSVLPVRCPGDVPIVSEPYSMHRRAWCLRSALVHYMHFGPWRSESFPGKVTHGNQAVKRMSTLKNQYVCMKWNQLRLTLGEKREKKQREKGSHFETLSANKPETQRAEQLPWAVLMQFNDWKCQFCK